MFKKILVPGAVLPDEELIKLLHYNALAFCQETLFAMAKIQRIGHGHQAPFWHLVENQAVTQSKNKLSHAQYTSEPQDFYRFRTPYKITTRSVDYMWP